MVTEDWKAITGAVCAEGAKVGATGALLGARVGARVGATEEKETTGATEGALEGAVVGAGNVCHFEDSFRGSSSSVSSSSVQVALNSAEDRGAVQTVSLKMFRVGKANSADSPPSNAKQ
jgi:hypothetical protein